MDIERYVARQHLWSSRTFGPGRRTEGLCRHIEKELAEIRGDPADPQEWADVVILGLEGLIRCVVEYEPDMTAESVGAIVAEHMIGKQRVNFAREWPPSNGQHEPTEHVR